MLDVERPPWVKYHNIVGRLPEKGLLGRVIGGTDGVVSFASGHLDSVRSEIAVEADHTALTAHPLSVLEVRRILLEHLAEVDAPPPSRLEHMPMTASSSTTPQEGVLIVPTPQNAGVAPAGGPIAQGFSPTPAQPDNGRAAPLR
jgi:hypothetical protein